VLSPLLLVPHGALLKADGGEGGCVHLHLLLQLGDLRRDALLQKIPEVLELGAAFALNIYGDGHSPGRRVSRSALVPCMTLGRFTEQDDLFSLNGGVSSEPVGTLDSGGHSPENKTPPPPTTAQGELAFSRLLYSLCEHFVMGVTHSNPLQFSYLRAMSNGLRGY